MANFLDSTADIELRLHEYQARLARIEALLRRGDKRPALLQLDGFLDELIEFGHEIQLPLETVVVGSQVGFFTGGEFFRGRLPGALLGAAVGWLYGQQVLQRHRLALQALAANVEALTFILERDARETQARATAEIDRHEVAAPKESDDDAEEKAGEHDRVTMEMDRK